MITHNRHVVEQAARGDRKAFDRLHQEHASKLHNFVRRFVRCKEDQEDAVAETFERALHSLGSFDNRSSFATWLYKIGTNVCIDILKEKHKILVQEPGDLERDALLEVADSAPTPEQLVFWRQILAAVPTCAAEFRPPWETIDYKILYYHCQQGYSFRETALKLQMGQSAVQRRFERKIKPVLETVAAEFEIPYVPKRDASASRKERS